MGDSLERYLVLLNCHACCCGMDWLEMRKSCSLLRVFVFANFGRDRPTYLCPSLYSTFQLFALPADPYPSTFLAPQGFAEEGEEANSVKYPRRKAKYLLQRRRQCAAMWRESQMMSARHSFCLLPQTTAD